MGELAIKTEFQVSEIEKMAGAISGSGLFGMKKKEEAFALMLIAQAEGRHPASVAMDYDIIQGRTALKSQAALRRFQEAGGRVEWKVRTASNCTAVFSHPQGGSIEIVWDMARAKSMGLDQKDNWKKQPMVMLSWRCVAEGVRLCFPACLSGQYLDSEVQDFEPANKPAPIDTPASIEPAEPAPIMTEAEVFQGRMERAGKKGAESFKVFMEIVNKFLEKNNCTMEELTEANYATLNAEIMAYKPEGKAQ